MKIKVGDKVTVKVIGIDEQGRVNLTAILEEEKSEWPKSDRHLWHIFRRGESLTYFSFFNVYRCLSLLGHLIVIIYVDNNFF